MTEQTDKSVETAATGEKVCEHLSMLQLSHDCVFCVRADLESKLATAEAALEAMRQERDGLLIIARSFEEHLKEVEAAESLNERMVGALGQILDCFVALPVTSGDVKWWDLAEYVGCSEERAREIIALVAEHEVKKQGLAK